MHVQATFPVSPQLIADLMCTAFESGSYGCKYWMPKVRPPKGFESAPEHGPWYCDPACWTPGKGHVVKFWEDTNDDGIGDKLIKLEVDTLPEKLQAIATKDPVRFAEFLKSDDEPLDGPAAESFLQLLLLGEIVYG